MESQQMKSVIGHLPVRVEKDWFQRKGAVFIKGMFHPFPCAGVCLGQLDKFPGVFQVKSAADVGAQIP